MFSRWIVTNITSASVTTFLAFLAGIISWSVYCTRANGDVLLAYSLLDTATSPLPMQIRGLFNDAVSSSDLRLSSNGKMNANNILENM
jgi:hypothetical protein